MTKSSMNGACETARRIHSLITSQQAFTAPEMSNDTEGIESKFSEFPYF
jgi:hypothetical protein